MNILKIKKEVRLALQTVRFSPIANFQHGLLVILTRRHYRRHQRETSSHSQVAMQPEFGAPSIERHNIDPGKTPHRTWAIWISVIRNFHESSCHLVEKDNSCK